MSSDSAEVQVRPGAEKDLDAVTKIYDHCIRETPITFDTVPCPRGAPSAALPS